MPVYDVRCATHGVSEVHRPIALFREPFVCPATNCGLEAEQVIRPIGMRVEDYDSIGSERGNDCPGEYIGLPDKKISLGKDANGKEHFRFEARNVGEIRNRRQFLEAAKEAGLSPGDGGRFRTVGQR